MFRKMPPAFSMMAKLFEGVLYVSMLTIKPRPPSTPHISDLFSVQWADRFQRADKIDFRVFSLFRIIAAFIRPVTLPTSRRISLLVESALQDRFRRTLAVTWNKKNMIPPNFQLFRNFVAYEIGSLIQNNVFQCTLLSKGPLITITIEWRTMFWIFKEKLALPCLILELNICCIISKWPIRKDSDTKRLIFQLFHPLSLNFSP